MYDITYCNIGDCKNWTCEKADSCKRCLEIQNIPENIPFSIASLFNICKEKDYHLYIPYNKEKNT